MDPAMRIHALRGVRREVIGGDVVNQYTLLDEHLGTKIVQHLFPKKKFIKLWKTRTFERFNFFILEQKRYKHVELLRGFLHPKEYKLEFFPVWYKP